MDAFANWILFLSGLISLSMFIRISLKQTNIVHIGFTLSLLAFCVTMSAVILQASGLNKGSSETFEVIVSWATISSAAFMLSAVTGLIREAKPTFARFPRIFCAFPLLLIPLNVWGQHTLVLKDWMLGLYLAGGLFILALILTVFFKKDHFIWIIFGSLVLLTFAHVIVWFNVGLSPEFERISWKSLFAGGMVLFSIGFYKVATHSAVFFSESIFANSQHPIKNK